MKSRVQRMIRFIYFRKVRSRFLAALILLSLPPLLLLGFISFNIAKETLVTNNSQSNLDHLETSSKMADLLLRKFVNLNQSIVLDPDIRNELRLSKTDENANLLEMNSRIVNRLQRGVYTHLFDTRFVQSVCLFDVHFQIYCSGRSDDAGIYEMVNKASAIEQSDWYQQAVQAQGGVVYFSYNVFGDKQNSFSSVKLFRDSESVEGEPLGLVIVNVSKSMFGSVFNNSGNSGQLAAIDSTGPRAGIVYAQNPAMERLLTEGSGSAALARLRGQGYIVSEVRNQTTGWIFLHMIKEKELLKESNRIGTVTIFIGSLIAFVALVISFIVSGGITRPLLQIKKMMVEWTKGTREFDFKFKEDEVGAIGESFKRMAIENDELNARLFRSELKEREAELRALQAQIKPHFLYNTLDAIYLMARLNKTKEAAQMTLSLSESFKLSLNNGKEMIPVFKELEHIHHYITIQTIRFKDRFRYVEEVDCSVMGIEILKLLLQPLVENAIYHGLEPKVGGGCVRLEGRKEGCFLLFVVEDDGVGMDDVARTGQGYGLRNVRERLTLHYGPSSEMKILSTTGRGTRIELRIQLDQEEVNPND